MGEVTDTHWLSVIARTLACLSLQSPELRDQKLGAKSEFLRGLGFSFKDSAAMLNSTEASIRELARLSRKAKKGKKKHASNR